MKPITLTLTCPANTKPLPWPKALKLLKEEFFEPLIKFVETNGLGDIDVNLDHPEHDSVTGDFVGFELGRVSSNREQFIFVLYREGTALMYPAMGGNEHDKIWGNWVSIAQRIVAFFQKRAEMLKLHQEQLNKLKSAGDCLKDS